MAAAGPWRGRNTIQRSAHRSARTPSDDGCSICDGELLVEGQWMMVKLQQNQLCLAIRAEEQDSAINIRVV
jgi:hypothetical protein